MILSCIKGSPYKKKMDDLYNSGKRVIIYLDGDEMECTFADDEKGIVDALTYDKNGGAITKVQKDGYSFVTKPLHGLVEIKTFDA